MVTGDLYHLVTVGGRVWSLRVDDLMGALLHHARRLDCNLIQNKGWVNSAFGELCRAIMLGRTHVRNACFWNVPMELLVHLFHWCHRPFIEGIVSLKGENRALSHYKNSNQWFIYLKTLNTIGKDSLLWFSSSDFKWLLVSGSCWKCQIHISLFPALPTVVQTCSYNFVPYLYPFLRSVKTPRNPQALTALDRKDTSPKRHILSWNQTQYFDNFKPSSFESTVYVEEQLVGLKKVHGFRVILSSKKFADLRFAISQTSWVH